MGFTNTFCRTAAAVLLCLMASLNLSAAEAEDKPVIIMDTFDVHGNAEGFFKLIDKAIRLAREVDPEGGGQIHVLAGHSDPGSASQVIVFTTYPNMDAYINNRGTLEENPKLQAVFEEMQAANFTFVQRTMNTLVAEY